jgi:micrococcal nuclease
VWLEKDSSDTDTFGRLLRYVYSGDIFVNAELVRIGYGRSVRYPPDIRHNDYYEQLQANAPRPACMPPPLATLPASDGQPGAGVYDCAGPDLDCADLVTQDNAQTCYNYCLDLGYGDVFYLDGDEDGVACASLP